MFPTIAPESPSALARRRTPANREDARTAWRDQYHPTLGAAVFAAHG